MCPRAVPARASIDRALVYMMKLRVYRQEVVIICNEVWVSKE